ncbi:unnamed protein product [Hymenolepis diminuta]|uniref:BZIP domain-containing protein n=1 Tax=Hymenolepis diminuta TaxID=6216 RepID=A0A0R3SUE7_HYMDI|nr:unnamed protein product [Hymenolepis diminuta]
MSSSVPATNNNNNSRKSTSSPSSSASTNSSDFTKEQWLELLRILPTTSLVNLQLAWKEFVEETAGQRNPEQKTLLPDASTLVRAVATQQNELAQNAYDKLRFDALLKQQLDVDRKALEQPNGLDALAAAALANTNSETNVTSTSAVTVFQGKPVPGTSLVAIPFTPQIAPAILGGFKSDSNQRQSPTIRETPKRLAATRAEAEQAAQVHGSSSNESVKRSRLSNDGSVEDMDTSNPLSQISSGGNLLLSNGALSAVASLKPDPEGVNPNYSFQTNTQDISGNWNLHSLSSVNAPASTSSGVTTAENNRRRARDEGITEDEAARREKRRERNRVAAAKCRQNRQNQIEDLKSRRKMLEDEGNQRNGCPTAQQYYQDGNLILPLSVAVAVAAASGNTAIPRQQPVTASLDLPTMAPVQSSLQILQSSSTRQLPPSITTTVIKSEAPNSSPPQPFVPAQRPSTLPLVNSTKVELPTSTLDSNTSSTTASQFARMWSPSVASKIKTPGGESWVNSQIGLPPISVTSDKDGIIPTTTTTLLSTPDILHHLGVTLGAASLSNNSSKTQDEKMSNATANTSSAT